MEKVIDYDFRGPRQMAAITARWRRLRDFSFFVEFEKDNVVTGMKWWMKVDAIGSSINFDIQPIVGGCRVQSINSATRARVSSFLSFVFSLQPMELLFIDAMEHKHTHHFFFSSSWFYYLYFGPGSLGPGMNVLVYVLRRASYLLSISSSRASLDRSYISEPRRYFVGKTLVWRNRLLQ